MSLHRLSSLVSFSLIVCYLQTTFKKCNNLNWELFKFNIFFFLNCEIPFENTLLGSSCLDLVCGVHTQIIAFAMLECVIVYLVQTDLILVIKGNWISYICLWFIQYFYKTSFGVSLWNGFWLIHYFSFSAIFITWEHEYKYWNEFYSRAIGF